LLGQGPVDRADELFDVQRLDQVRGGLAVDRLERAAEGGLPRDEDDHGLRRGGLDALQQIDSGDVGQPEIDNREVHGLPPEMLEGLLSSVRGPHSVPSMLQHVADGGAQPRVVVDHENVRTFTHECLPEAHPLAAWLTGDCRKRHTRCSLALAGAPEDIDQGARA
jgi:hypothetical protein